MNGRAFEDIWDDLQDELVRQLIRQRVGSTDHAKAQMKSRGIDFLDIKYVIWNNLADEMFKPYEYPHGEKSFSNVDPVFSVTGQDKSGRFATVAFAIQQRNNRLQFSIVTAIAPVSPISRHRNRK